MKKVARIFQEMSGKFYVCSDELDYMDATGPSYGKKSEALWAASELGYTHAVGSGTYWTGTRSIAKYGGDGRGY